MTGMQRIFQRPPELVGHRGLGAGTVAGQVENTPGSYLAAAAAGLRWVELDVRRSADDVLVLAHNPATDDGSPIIDQSADAAGLPRLTDVLDMLPAGVGVDFDVKTEFEDATDPVDRTTVGLLTEVLRAEAARRPLLVESFDPSVLLHLREHAPQVPLALMTWIRFPLPFAVPAAARFGVQVLCLDTRSFHLDADSTVDARPPEYAIEVAHRAGLEVAVWCPDGEQSRWFAGAGADALVVNDPAAIRAALEGPAEPDPQPAADGAADG